MKTAEAKKIPPTKKTGRASSASQKGTPLEISQFIFNLLGGKKAIHKPVSSELDYLDLSIHGLPKSSIQSIALYLGIPMKDMAGMINLSPKTLERKKATDLLDEVVSSQVIEIATIAARGVEVFDNLEKFKRWLNKENRALRGKRPIDIMNTATGLKFINTILIRIEEGVYA